jgi:hypothetical protein
MHYSARVGRQCKNANGAGSQGLQPLATPSYWISQYRTVPKCAKVITRSKAGWCIFAAVQSNLYRTLKWLRRAKSCPQHMGRPQVTLKPSQCSLHTHLIFTQTKQRLQLSAGHSPLTALPLLPQHSQKPPHKPDGGNTRVVRDGISVGKWYWIWCLDRL